MFFSPTSIERQIDDFQKSIPDTEDEIDDGLWFFDEKCPGAAVLINESGS